MNASFQRDAHAGRPRILFVGLGESSHTHSWVDLLEGARFNVRLFALPTGLPPDSWPVRTYVTAYTGAPLDPATRAWFYPRKRGLRFARRILLRALSRVDVNGLQTRWLASVISEWRPDVIHTLGLEAAEFYLAARERHGLERIGKWVLQTRGGSDLALSHLNPELWEKTARVLRACDQLLSDNQQNLRIAREMGVGEEQFARTGTTPGTGGIDVDALAARWQGRPSERELVLVPKAYECPWSKILPVFEALKIAWASMGDASRRFRVHLLAATPETRMWYWALPEDVRAACTIEERLPRERALELMTRARVMLAPSLVDGVPNSMYEAMAAGAFPVVSPLETITPVVEPERNVLFARNLYPEEIAAALSRALTDDALVDGAAETNLALVRRVADRRRIRERVVEFYESLAAEVSS
ncbi:MAG TPA: glycosyltransferase [Pyrinomonadaceae bacterium]|nr:glycosyltransferase [Pyrinomonadaceae bacterium]